MIHPRRFVVAPGHRRAGDQTIASADCHVIVAKNGTAGAPAAGADPGPTVRAARSDLVPTPNFAFPATAEAAPRARHWVGEFVNAHTDDRVAGPRGR